jgi:hypothetical protein
MFPNPANPHGRIDASAPPQMMQSASPNLMIRHASPMLLFDVAHAVTITMFGPMNPNSAEIIPLAMLVIIIGIRNGDTRLGLFSKRI